MTVSFHEKIQTVERLSDELGHLLIHNRLFLEQSGMHSRARHLAQWGRCYRHGLRYGLPTSGIARDMDTAWLSGVGDRLRLESGELNDDIDLDLDEDIGERPETHQFIESAQQVIHIVFAIKRKSNASPPAIQSPKPVPLLPSMEKEKPIMRTRVKDIMKKNPVIIPLDFTLKEAAQEMEVANCGALPVGTDKIIVGIITDRDIVLRAVAKGKDVSKELVRNYMTPEICSIHEDDTSDRAAGLMREKNINRILVKNAQGSACGILTFGRLIRENGSMQDIATVIERTTGRKVA